MDSSSTKRKAVPPRIGKRNTVDTIVSKISYDSVIPVTFLPDPRSFIAKCKPYDIIQGKIPIDVADVVIEQRSPQATSPPRRPSLWRRSLSPPLKLGKPEETSEEDEEVNPEFFVSTISPSPLLGKVAAPTRPQWAAKQLSDSTPYQLLCSRDAKSRVRYILDDADFVWCRANDVSPESLQRCITYLEWANVSYLLQARPTSEKEPKKGELQTRYNGSSASKTDNPCALCGKAVEIARSDGHRSTSFVHGTCGALGMQCCECDTVSHLQCWYVSVLPHRPEQWQCDGCFIASQHKRRYTVRCIVCGRAGGVLLPYRAKGAEVNGVDSGSSTGTSHMAHVSGDAACHAACALAFPELSIRQSPTILLRSGAVDMSMRPCVVPSRRFSKQWQSLNCMYCQHASFPCVQCHHPRCYETMHPSCAADAGTLDCYYTDDRKSLSNPGSPTSEISHTSPSFKSIDTSFEVPSSSVADLPPSSFLPTQWSGCSAYCPKHFGFSLSNSVGSSSLAVRAEKEAMQLDLTGLLTGHVPDDSTAPPVVKKRGRGRPPLALAKRRMEEKGLVEQLKQYWLQRRQSRRMVSATWINEINVTKTRPILCCALRPELIKISATQVRLSHYLCLVPEWQQMLVVALEGELPLPDEEYDDVQQYRKTAVAQTRRAGNTVELLQRLHQVKDNLDTVMHLTEQLKQASALRTKEVELELSWMDKLCDWS